MNDPTLALSERPHPDLWKLYLCRCLCFLPVLPLFPIILMVNWFRYRSLRYRFDDEGVHCSWGVWVRQEVNVSYSRMQDIHLVSGVLQRWLGLADIQIQTASGNSGPELILEGFKNSLEVRDYLDRRMRATHPAVPSASRPLELSAVLALVADELKATRLALEKLTPPTP